MCEHKNQLQFAKRAAVKAVQTKKDCQGEDCPDFLKYLEVLNRIVMKLESQQE